MQKRFKLYAPVIAVLFALGAALVALTYFYDKTLFYISAAVACTVFGIVLIMLLKIGKKNRRYLEELSRSILRTGDGNYPELPLPAVTVHNSREIVWCNEHCIHQVFGGIDRRGEIAAELFPQLDFTRNSPPEGCDILFGERRYTAFVSCSVRYGENIAVLLLADDGKLKYFADQYFRTRPTVALVLIDNYEELAQDYKENERSALAGDIASAVEEYFAQNSGFVVKTGRDRFLVVVEQQGLRKIIDQKFDILDTARAICPKGRMNATLSIGVGQSDSSFYESEETARQALDMCLGRGGDQAALRTQAGYEFFGGVSKGVEKRTKVKTRIIATALSELIESCGNIIIMGHRYADLDCMGASVGILKSVKEFGKPAVICVDPDRNLVRPLMDKLLDGGCCKTSDFVPPGEVMSLLGDRTLLIILDTHIPNVLESETLYRACKNVVVIDHHRKLVNYIDNAMIFYHEPYASSACEMVTELVQYFPVPPLLNKLESEALMAGIMLDTRNFVLRTGVRTFEAAAYLRRLGADTVEVRKLFASSLDAYQQKISIVSTADIYRRCAIAMAETPFEGIKMTAAQAADELMSISDVDASFVLFEHDDTLSISARSMGAVNVQLIMERLGGGGHLTMAAAQLAGETAQSAKKHLIDAIDSYYAAMAASAT